MTLVGNGQVREPRDFGSAWLLLLDEKGALAWQGPLDGGNMDPRGYEDKDLAAPTLEQPLVQAFPLPKGIPPGRYTLRVGAILEGAEIISDPLDWDVPAP